jgi:AAA domain
MATKPPIVMVEPVPKVLMTSTPTVVDRNGWKPTFVVPGTTPKLKLLVYGPPGVGKTTLAASASLVPEMSPVLFVSLEGGTLAISENLEGFINPDNITVTEFNGLKDLDKLLEWLETTAHGYKTVVFDSVSDMQEHLIDAWQKMMMPKGEEGLPDLNSADKAIMRVFGKTTDSMRERLRKLRDLPTHVVFVCAEADTSGSTTQKAFMRYPALMPKIRQSVIGYMDVVARLYIKPGESGDVESTRLLLCTPTNETTAKDRSPGGKLGKIIQDPTMGKIMALLTGKANV